MEIDSSCTEAQLLIDALRDILTVALKQTDFEN